MSPNTVLSIFDLSPRRIGGIETFARELSLQLADRGWESVLCFRSEPAETVRAFLDLPNVRLEIGQGLGNWNLQSAARLSELLGRHRPSVLHLYFTNDFGPYAWLARLRGVHKVFFTDQTSRPEDYQTRPAPLWKRGVYRAALPLSKVFCISEFVKQCWIDSCLLPHSRLVTIYNSVDIGHCERSRIKASEFRHRFSLPSDSVVVSQVSSLIPEKGCADLLEAAKRVVDVDPNVRFVFAGDGRHRSEYEALSRRLCLNDHVIFTGLIEDPIGEGLFAASDIVCQVSRWNEAFGFVIAEAMASGKPIIATRVGGIPELVTDGKTGRLVDRGDVDALVMRILELASQRKLREEFGRSGKERCARLFDHKHNVARLIEHYQPHRTIADGSVCKRGKHR